MSKLLFLVRDDAEDSAHGRALGAQLMERGHTVFLTDTDDDIEFFGDVIDAFLEVRPLGDAVLYRVGDKAAPSRTSLEQRGVLGLLLDESDDAEIEKLMNEVRPENELLAMFEEDGRM